MNGGEGRECELLEFLIGCSFESGRSNWGEGGQEGESIQGGGRSFEMVARQTSSLVSFGSVLLRLERSFEHLPRLLHALSLSLSLCTDLIWKKAALWKGRNEADRLPHLLPFVNSVETETITTSTDPYTGRKCLNQYAILNELGKGQHGKVRLARDMETNTLWVSPTSLRSFPGRRRRRPLGLSGLGAWEGGGQENGDADLPPFSLSLVVLLQAVKIISRQQKKRLPGFSSAPKQPVQPGQIEDK